MDQMSPFLKLLTVKAHDLVLLERQPLPMETATQLIEGFEAHAMELSLRHWWRVVVALPGRFIFGLVAMILGLGFIPLLFGVGRGLVGSYFTLEARKRPTAIVVSGVRKAGSELPREILTIASALAQAGGRESRSVVLAVKAAPFASATPAFVIEASHPSRPIRYAFALVRPSNDELGEFAVVPVQRDGGRFRALLPPQPAGQCITFFLVVDAEGEDDAMVVGREVVLRPLD